MPSSDPASLVNRLQGISGALGRKAPVRVATTGNVALTGLQVIDGYQLIEGHRVLLKDQTIASENGIWNASSGNWTRSQDFNKRDDVANGTDVVTAYGSQAGRNYVVSFVEPLTFGTTALTFTSRDAAALADGSVTTAKLGDVAVTTGKIADRNVTYPKLPQAPAVSFMGRNGGVAGDYGSLTVSDVKAMLGRWTNAELADMAPLTFKGNSSPDTTGAAQDLSVATVKTMLGINSLAYLPLAGGTLTGALTLNGGKLTVTLGGAVGTVALEVNNDIRTWRSAATTTGAVFLGQGGAYLYFDGTRFQTSHELVANGNKVGDAVTTMRMVDAGLVYRNTNVYWGGISQGYTMRAMLQGPFYQTGTDESGNPIGGTYVDYYFWLLQFYRPNIGWVNVGG